MRGVERDQLKVEGRRRLINDEEGVLARGPRTLSYERSRLDLKLVLSACSKTFDYSSQ